MFYYYCENLQVISANDLTEYLLRDLEDKVCDEAVTSSVVKKNVMEGDTHSCSDLLIMGVVQKSSGVETTVLYCCLKLFVYLSTS